MIEDRVEVVDGSDLLPGQSSVGETVKRMVKTVILPGSEFDNDIDREIIEEEDRIRAAFDRGATLRLPIDETTAAGPPIPPSRKPKLSKPTTKGGRPAGADELTGLFAAGFITLITFLIGEWALPTEQEANDLARPLGNILARRIDLAAKLGRDANDTIAFTIAVMAYLVRVGPIGVERARYWRDQRRDARESREFAERSADADGADSMVAGDNGRTGTRSGPSYNPLDAIAKARASGLGVLDRDFGYPTGPNPAMADFGENR